MENIEPMEETLERIYRSFETSNRTDVYQLITGCLVLLPGQVKEKVEIAIQLSRCRCGDDNDNVITFSIVCMALSCLLQSLCAVFDLRTTTDDQLKSTTSIISTCVEETVACTFAACSLGKDDTASFDEQIWPWIKANSSSSQAIMWINLLDPNKWPGMSSLSQESLTDQRLLEESPSINNGEDGESDVECDEEEDDSTELSFRFSSVDGGVLTIGEQQAVDLYDLLAQSAFTRVAPQAMYDTFIQHTGDGLLEEETFLEAIEELLSMTDKPHLMEKNTFLESILAIFRSFLPDNCRTVDAFEIAAGFSLMSWGSKSDKLASAFHYFDLTLFCSDMVRLTELVDKGEEEILEAIMEGLLSEVDEEEDEERTSDGSQDDEEKLSADSENGGNYVDEIAGDRPRAKSDMRLGLYTFEEFGLWYNGGGYKGMSWLELLDLRKWVFVSPSFTLESLDTRSVDPAVASNNYYTANNIQVDIDAVDSPERAPVVVVQGPPSSAASIGSSSTVARSYNSSTPATLPAICLKNEIVLEFDLPFDADNDALTELPLTTLSFDNGDLIQYFEVQRVIKLNQMELYRVYDVFEPYMEKLSSACIEKRTFDKCVGKLLPFDVAPSVAAAFDGNSNMRVSSRSVVRAKDSKMVADTLSRLFFAFNRGGTGKIDLVEFVSAFTMFCAGSKSEKLAFAYRLFDADGDGCLTRREMWKYLRAFLTMLLALGNGSELSAEAIASVADTTAIEIADCIFKDTDKTFSTRQSISSVREDSQRHSLNLPAFVDSASQKGLSRHRCQGRYEHRGSFPDDTNLHLVGAASSASGADAGRAFIRGGVVSFEEFAVWYSRHGYTIIAWIELLDTKKWPEVSPSVSDAILRYISRQQHALENATQMESDETGSGSSNDTVSSNESSNRVHESLVPNFPESDMTALDTTAFRTSDRYAVEEGMDAVSGIANLITSPTASTAAVKDLSSVALQFKLTSYDNTTLRIRLKDVAIVYTISERMNFSRMTCGELVHLLKKHAHNRSLTKHGYLRVMRDLVPRDELSNEEQEFLSFHLLRIFTLFESESVLQSGETNGINNTDEGERQSGTFASGVDINTISVETLQLVAGMCVFCGTTKSAKLGALFKLFASHGDGHVSRRRLFELLKSILVVLFAFSSYNATRDNLNDTGFINSWSTNSIAGRAAGALVSKIFCEATCKRPDSISLAEFAAWYAAGGYMDCPWLELLDLSKWPAKEAFEASKREKPLIYAFDMLEEGNILHFTESDISTYLFVLRSTKLGELSSRRGQMYSYAAVEEDEGAYLVLTRANFYKCVRSLVSKDGMSEKAQQTSSKLLSRLFNVFDRKRCGRVNALELACGLSILGRGSKSQKLSLAFDFITKMRQQRHKTLASYAPVPLSTSVSLGGFGTQAPATGGFGFGLGSVQSSQLLMSNGACGFPSTRDFGSSAQEMRGGTTRHPPPSSAAEISALPHSVLFIYLRSFLLTLMALSDGTYRLGLEKIYVEADDFIEEAMGDLMTDVTTNGGANGTAVTSMSGYGSARSRTRVTFEQFGEWYNTGGYQLISWVELLDVSKWQQQQDFQDMSMVTSGTGPTSVYQSQRIASYIRSQNRGPMSTAAPMPMEDAANSTLREARDTTAAGAISLCSDGPVMVFAIAKDAAELQFFNEDISTLKLFLRQTQLHTVTSWELQGAVLEAKYAKPLLCRVNLTIKLDFLSDEGVEMLHSLLGVFVAEPGSEAEDEQQIAGGEVEDDGLEDPTDVGAAICGLLVVCEGSMLEKLKCCAALISDDDGESADKCDGEGDEEEEGNGLMVMLEAIKSSLMCFLMAFYGMSSSLSAEMARYSSELGADAVLQSFAESLTENSTALDLKMKVSLRVFCDWFSESGYPSHSWLELAELNHWPAAINVCGSNGMTDDTD
ncbi:unnamed protein product [Peronospora destructor]|uniref:EF-hand domain-containing protein n=1 Tax=Peronospora destructor TaxID=86335 RepID=A0AAV0V1K7_9STRA|nr:unnamed protein product [Peronospora destructor]